jgi:hypothetical protein
MKTMMELLISLQRVEHSMQVARQRRQLTPLETRHGEHYLNLVREIVPAEALVHYDRMKTTAADLLDTPELFAMAVLLATYGSLSPQQRKEFVNHFATQPCPQPSGNGHEDNRPASVRNRSAKATRRQLTAGK